MSVDEVVNVRLAALSAAERLLLEQAAAAGNVFWSGALVVLHRAGGAAPELWEDADGGDVAALHDALRSLVERGYLARVPGSRFAGSDEYAFLHSKEREALQRRTSPAALRRHHRAIADWLEQQGAVRGSEEHLAVLASHREQVGDAIGAGLAFLDAGDVARERYANVRAAEHYERGLGLLGGAYVARRIDALHHYGDVLQLAGRVEDALAAFREMLTLAYRLDNRRKGGAAHNRIGRLHREIGGLEEAGRHLATALRLFEAAGDERGVASTIDDIGKLHWMKGEYKEALDALRDGLARRERLGDRRSIALSLNNIGLVLEDSGDFKHARAAFEQSLVIRREISDLLGIVASLNNLGTIAQDQQDFRRALELFREALEVARQVGDRNRTAMILTNIGETHYRSGDPDEGVRVLKEAEELCDELGDKLLLAEVLRGLGKAYLLRGDLKKARDAISRAVDLFASVRSKVQLGVSLRTLGEITAAGGWGHAHTKSARAYFDRSVAILGETGNEVELARTLRAYARYLTTEPAYANHRAARRDAALMTQRADAIVTRLQISSAAGDDAPSDPEAFRAALQSSTPPPPDTAPRSSPRPRRGGGGERGSGPPSG
jgi:tetratricopeptide (TPR) repeat protein